MRIYIFLAPLLFINSSLIHAFQYDVTFVGQINFLDGHHRLLIGLIDGLKDALSINFITSRANGIKLSGDVPRNVQKIVQDPDKTPGSIAFFLDILWLKKENPSRKVPPSKIKIAYLMVEFTEAPKEWVAILNEQFDVLVVPDPFLIEVFKNSGVEIPIFVIPCGLYLDVFLNEIENIKNDGPFVFGISAAFYPRKRKNHIALVQAFISEFGYDPNIELHIHGRIMGYPNEKKDTAQLRSLIKKYPNIRLTHKNFTQQDYINFMKSLHCMVLISKGEGFSITPREALALGTPCILSNNTGHKTLCESGHALCVETLKKEPVYHSAYGCFCGNEFGTEEEDIRRALREMYSNFEYYKGQATQGRQWVKQYLHASVLPLYRTLLKPPSIKLGENNQVTRTCLTTNSRKLYEKYENLNKV